MEFIKRNVFLIVLVVLCLAFFNKTILSGLLPIPADTIVGLYYPFRDNYVKTNPNGLPYKNFLITDPVRQTYPWKNLSINLIKKAQLPLWNPYNFSGTPLLANFQSSVFYPFNLLLLILPFSMGWGTLIILQPILGGIFMFLYLKNLRLKNESSFLGSIVFSFSGFSIAWLEWGTIFQTALWLPLILLSVDKIINREEKIKIKDLIVWTTILTLSLSFSFFAGHLQTFFYIFIISVAYILFRSFEQKSKFKSLLFFIIPYLLFVLLTFIQWYPTLQFILLSARDADLVSYKTVGWFIPLQNIIQFIAPDFFGNPSTLNYFGEWNYGEFIGYVGIIPLIFALFAIAFNKTKETLFFLIVLLIALIFAFPNPASQIPFMLNLPFISTAQPTRLIFLADFALAILAAVGLEEYLKRSRKIIFILPIFILIIACLWGFTLAQGFGLVTAENLQVIKQNLKLPTLLVFASVLILTLPVIKIINKEKKILTLLVVAILAISIFDLFRFGWKFESFSPASYLFPNTKVISYIQNQPGIYRTMSTDSRIFPPNFSVMYNIYSPDGYDPLYLRRYGELIAAYARNKPDIATPLGFNRIVTLQNPDSRIVDLLGIKYVLSFDDPQVSKLSKVYSDGIVSVYQNNSALERIFFVPTTKFVNTNQEAIAEMFDINYSFDKRAIVQGMRTQNYKNNWDVGKVKINDYTPNKVNIATSNKGDGFLVLTDAYYPTWSATIDGEPAQIFITDYAFRGIIVPKGNHIIEFINGL